MPLKGRNKSFLQRIAGRLAFRAAKYAGIPLRDPALVAMLGQQPSAAGVDVDEAIAMNCSAVYAAVNLLSSTIGSLPRHVMMETARGHVEDKTHPVKRVTSIEPNPEMTPMVFNESEQAHALTWGNAYARIEREDDNPESTPIALWPLLPNQVEPDRSPEGDIVYKFKAHYMGEKDEVFQPWQVLHVPGLGFDGLRGYSPVQQAREAIGLHIALERFAASFFGRGTTPAGVIEHPGELEEPAVKNLRETWELLYRGPDNAHRVAILDEGMTYKPITIPPEDAQFLQSRQFQVIEIARWFSVPPHMLRDLSQATFSNIEHQGIEFLTYSLRPWLVRWAQEYKRKLFTISERMRYFVDFDVTALLKTDTQARYAAYQQGRLNGWLSLNDILRAENMNPLSPEIGDTHLQPVNTVVIEKEQEKLAATANEAVSNTALDGSQLTSMLAILTAVGSNQLNPVAAKALIQIAFPKVPAPLVDAMLSPYTKTL